MYFRKDFSPHRFFEVFFLFCKENEICSAMQSTSIPSQSEIDDEFNLTDQLSNLISSKDIEEINSIQKNL